MTLADTFRLLDAVETAGLAGTVSEIRGLTLLVDDLPCPVGAVVRVETRRGPDVTGEVVGFDDHRTIVMLMGFTSGLKRGDRVHLEHAAPIARVGDDLLGRVVDGFGRPIDEKGTLRETIARSIHPDPIDPLHRATIDQPLGTGVRAIDTALTAGRGQRLGVFAGPGIGKSTLLGMMAKYTDAHVSVVALIGERGREVRDFIENSLGEEGLRRSVVIAATGDEPAPMRVRAAMYACSVAEHFRDQGLDVVFLMDSVTRFCQAQRQIGLAAGEPPATKGFPPSMFSMLPVLLERSGRTDRGSITGFYAILVEGDDLTEPVSDTCRGILDGHIVLSRELANRNHWPAIDVLESVSRVARAVTDADHQAARGEVVRLLSLYAEVEDMVNIGAYAPGSNPDYDLAIAMRPAILELLQQSPENHVNFETARSQLLELAGQVEQQRRKTHQAGGTRTAGST